MAYLEDQLQEFWPMWAWKPFAALMRAVRTLVFWLERDARYKYRGRRPPGRSDPPGPFGSGDRSPLAPRGPHFDGAAAQAIPRE